MTAVPAPERRRESCARCRRPPRVCYCAALPPQLLAARDTHVLVLQHRYEQRRRAAISSIPVLAQVLAAATVVAVDDAGVAPGSSEELDRLLFGGAFARVFVLFPDAAAKTLDAELLRTTTAPTTAEAAVAHSDATGAAAVATSELSTLLVAVDGTWTQAKKIVFHSRPHLEALATQRRALGRSFEFVCLDSADAADATNIYGDLRREPKEGCMATLEAVALALKALEPPASGAALSDALLAGFREMIARQQELTASGRQQTLERHGGVSKRDAALQRKKRALEETATAASSPPAESTEDERAAQRRVREYVFVATRVDFRQRSQLVQEGGSVRCTYDEARERCRALNAGRARGQRLAMVPLDTFRQQALALEQELHADADTDAARASM